LLRALRLDFSPLATAAQRSYVNTSLFDVVIAGGGPVGWACALAAQVSLGKRARIAVVERDPLLVINAGDPMSARVYTVASGNLAWLDEHGVKTDHARSAAVTDIRVFGRDGGDSLRVEANDAGLNELARVIEHEALALAIAERAQQAGVTLIAGECIALHYGDTANGSTRAVELADRSLLQGRMVLAADGAHSRLREAAGMEVSRHSYPQHGVVANLRCTTPHQSVARQWFLPDGSILALLPLPSLIDSTPSISMVWSVATDRAEFLSALSESQLIAEINAARAGILGVTPSLAALEASRSPCCACRILSLIAFWPWATPRMRCTRSRGRA